MLISDVRNAASALTSSTVKFPSFSPEVVYWDNNTGTFSVGTETIPVVLSSGTSLTVSGTVGNWCLTAFSEESTVGAVTYKNGEGLNRCPPESLLSSASWVKYPLGVMTQVVSPPPGSLFNFTSNTTVEGGVWVENFFKDDVGPYGYNVRVWETLSRGDGTTNGGWGDTTKVTVDQSASASPALQGGVSDPS